MPVAVAVGKDVAELASDLVIASPASTGWAAQGAGGGVEGLQRGFEMFTMFAHRASNVSRRREMQTENSTSNKETDRESKKERSLL